MKIRRGFVSNSSSSSYVVYIPYNPKLDNLGLKYIPNILSNNIDFRYNEPDDDTLVITKNFAKTDFGWGPEKITDTYSKIIFARLQAYYAENNKYLKLIEETIKEITGYKKILWEFNPETDGYIDHQSCASEGENTQMFYSKQDMINFLFGNSFIQLDNDNH